MMIQTLKENFIKKYLVFKFDKSIVEEIFGFILLNYDINFITEEIESLVYDENEIEYEYPEDPIYKHPLFYLDLLFLLHLVWWQFSPFSIML